MIAFLNPWPWYVSGPAIAAIMGVLLFLGKTFGLSSNLRTLCSMMGGGRFADFFRDYWPAKAWNLVFVAGAITGGALIHCLGSRADHVQISAATVSHLNGMGIAHVTGFGPDVFYAWAGLMTWKGFLVLSVGGFLIGFGTRYANGCTSGHAITGLSNLQKPSLIAVLGFFGGGLIMTWVLLPLLFKA